MFDTKYGIVSVLKDDRAVSTVELPSNLPSEMKKYSSSATKREVQVQKHNSNVATSSLARRMLLSRLYENNNCTQETVFDAYFGIDPRLMTKFRKPAPYPSMITNPSMPDGSFPDRIVECIMVPDKRPRFVGLGSPDALEGLAEETSARHPTKVFIQRRLLSQKYSEDATRYICGSCCHCFISKSGYQHHEYNGNCAQKIEAEKEKKVRNMKATEVRAMVAVQRHNNRDGPLATDPIVTKTTNIVNEKTGKKLKLKKIKREEKELVSPMQLLAQLKAELQTVQGSMIGPVYPQVWKALGYEKPKRKGKPKRKKKKKKKAAKRKAKHPAGGKPPKKANTAIVPQTQFRSPLHQPGSSIVQEWAAKLPVKPLVLLPQAPLIDSRALINEVDSGRYPTFKRFEGKHDTTCTLCKREGKPWKIGSRGRNRLFLTCHFCHRAVHFECVLKRYTLKEPEPEDEFMCHFCTATIVARRKRAEKRRLEKLDITPLGDEQVAAKNMEQVQLVSGALKGRENETIAAQVQRTEEVSELLVDSKTRLTLAMKIAQSNESLLAMVADFESQSAPYTPVQLAPEEV